MYNFNNTTSPNATSNSADFTLLGELILICHRIHLLLGLSVTKIIYGIDVI